MTIDDLAALPARLEAVERELHELKAATAAPALDRVTVTVEHAAEKLDVSEVDVRNYIKQGLLVGIHKSTGDKVRKWLITWESVLAFPARLQASQAKVGRATVTPMRSVDLDTEAHRLAAGGRKERRRG